MFLKLVPLAAFAGLALSGCMDTSGDGGMSMSEPDGLALFGDGYPNAGDPCKRAGESAVTVDYLDHTADLVACPPSTDAGLFAFTTGGTQVGVYQGWYIFSIPNE